jgi:hypothetical protein
MLNEKNQGPEDWMCAQPALPVVASPAQAREAARETIRQWYERTTKKWRMGLVWCTLIALVGAGVVYFIASFSFLARLQTFNGAMTIPIAGLIWLLAFVYIFLVPSREASFRSQEWIEAMVTIVERTVTEQVAPAALVWGRIGMRVEAELPGFLAECKTGMDSVNTAAVKLQSAVDKNEQISNDVGPVIESLKRIEARVEGEINTGLLDEVRAAARAVKALGGPVKADPVDYSAALGMMAKKK